MTSRHVVHVRLNGRRADIECTSDARLIDVLRDDLRLTGTKEGCSIGVCGLCTVLVDGTPMSACLMLMALVDGREITTIEGVADDDQLHPLQRAFISEGGFQCGICTPGQILAGLALLSEHPQPTAAETAAWMTGNLCRCTGYEGIASAIAAAAEAIR